MIAFLTSSPTGPLDGSRPVEGFDTMNGFREQLASRWPKDARCLMITAFPDDAAANDQMRDFFSEAVRLSGLSCVCFDLWDVRTPPLSAHALHSYGAYRRYLPGLGITKTCILPHYQMVKNRLLDGKRLFEDITYPDSFRQPFLALCDGSYLLCENGKETVFGEAYCIRNGEISTIMDNYR